MVVVFASTELEELLELADVVVTMRKARWWAATTPVWTAPRCCAT